MTKNISIPALTRVEGEGALYIRSKDNKIEHIELNIYEPPRFFEGFLQGRTSRRSRISLPGFVGFARSLTR